MEFFPAKIQTYKTEFLKSKMTEEDVARIARVSKSTVRYWLDPQHNTILKRVSKIAAVFGYELVFVKKGYVWQSYDRMTGVLTAQHEPGIPCMCLGTDMPHPLGLTGCIRRKDV